MYVIKRYFRSEQWPKTIKTDLTLEQAQAHCQRDDTQGPAICPAHGRTNASESCPGCGRKLSPEWFDGYIRV